MDVGLVEAAEGVAEAVDSLEPIEDVLFGFSVRGQSLQLGLSI